MSVKLCCERRWDPAVSNLWDSAKCADAKPFLCRTTCPLKEEDLLFPDIIEIENEALGYSIVALFGVLIISIIIGIAVALMLLRREKDKLKEIKEFLAEEDGYENNPAFENLSTKQAIKSAQKLSKDVSL